MPGRATCTVDSIIAVATELSMIMSIAARRVAGTVVGKLAFGAGDDVPVLLRQPLAHCRRRQFEGPQVVAHAGEGGGVTQSCDQ